MFLAGRTSRTKAPSAHWSLGTIYSIRQMRRALARERARSDRNSHGFVLAVFWTTAGGWWKRQRLARLVCRRARVMDEVGWFADGQIGVILPYASAERALCFSGEIERQAARKKIDVACRIYTYPSTEGGDNGPDGGGSNGHGKAKEHASAPHRTTAKPSRRMEPVSATAAADAGEALFVRPIPRWKRVMDIIGALFGLAIASPFMLLAALAIKLTSPGPIFFCQMRAGHGGQPFKIIKFRTMVQDAERLREQLKQFSEQDGPAFKLKNDPRITLIGRFLRATSLDELPQLFNILRGDMSLVGPRPLPLIESEECSQWHRARLDVTPGLTCIWQVKGRSRVAFDDWLRMDLQYIRSRGFVTDLKILLQTLPAVILRKGAH